MTNSTNTKTTSVKNNNDGRIPSLSLTKVNILLLSFTLYQAIYRQSLISQEE